MSIGMEVSHVEVSTRSRLLLSVLLLLEMVVPTRNPKPISRVARPPPSSLVSLRLEAVVAVTVTRRVGIHSELGREGRRKRQILWVLMGNKS